jgi:hypothetical protein
VALPAGTALGPYTILAAVGAGGMGEVYRARDTRLDREVAIKVLPGDVAEDTARLDRFAREARAAAALNHPNILAVHDVSVAGDTHFIVSELLEGQTLAERLQASAGGLSARRAIDLARQVAEGLGAAHARGIVHRDLKPANIFVTADGRAKILDFGLAKQAAPEPAGLTTTGAGRLPQTDPGQVLGTVGYMAPEQVRGLAVDARTDIFAFGAVLYEMLSGRRAFQADTSADTISAILGQDPPDLASTPDHPIPPALQRIVARCLEKDPAARFQSASDLAFALQSLTSESSSGVSMAAAAHASEAGGGSAPWRPRELALATIALASIGLAAWSAWPRTAPPPQVAAPVGQFDIDLPVEATEGATRLSLSPDGRGLVIYRGGRLWLQSMAEASGRLLKADVGTASGLFWAPDSSAVAFYSGGRLVALRAGTGSSEVVAEVGDLAAPISGAWLATGTIVLADGTGKMLAIDPSAGSRSARVVKDFGDRLSRRIAGVLRTPERLVYTVDAGPSEEVGVWVGPVAGTATFARVDDGRWDNGRVVDGNSVLLKRGTALYELRLSDDTARSLGTPRLVTTEMPVAPFLWSASTNGVLAHISTAPTRFTWFDAAGRRLASVGPAALWGAFAMDQAGEWAVATRAGGTLAVQHLWSLDLRREIDEQLTFSDARDSDPAISSGRIAHVSGAGFNSTTSAIEWLAGQPAATLFTDPAGVALDDWSADGRWAFYHQRLGLPGADPADLLVRDLQDPTASPKRLARCERGRVDETRAAPTGQWVAFNCDESGRSEVYMVPFPEGGTRVRVSLEGGVQPAWRGDGRELYFLALDGSMMAAGVGAGPIPTVERPRELFKTGLRPNPQSEQYRVTADGRRFLLQVPETGTPPLRVIVNWRERFKAER